MAKPTRERRPRLLALELWGLGDVALAIPFLRAAAEHADVTLLAQPHAAPLLARFAPEVRLRTLTAPWTAFRGKYRLHRWPWRQLQATLAELRRDAFDFALSARADPRDHLLMRLTGATDRAGFARRGSGLMLTRCVPPPRKPHRAAHWRALAEAMGWTLPTVAAKPPGSGRHVVIHPGAGQPLREWPFDRFAALAAHLTARGWQVTLLRPPYHDLGALLDILGSADRFIGNDSGPGHLAALLGVPTFTLFGPQLPELFAPQHPQAAWITGAPCRFKPCFDNCRFAAPHCLLDISVAQAEAAVDAWLR